jgi:hypothetical protein
MAGLVATIMLPFQVRDMCWELFKVHQPMAGMCTIEWQKCVPSFLLMAVTSDNSKPQYSNLVLASPYILLKEIKKREQDEE